MTLKPITEAPRKGQTVVWPDSPSPFNQPYEVLKVEGNLCWIKREGGEAAPFIWQFKDGFNTMARIVEDA